jgi:NAD(P)-dependent dehydrogenase (short-subunit alcohol dehydrogenase family)
MTTTKAVLVTGVSSGIGRETASLLASRGFRVFGTVRGDAAAARMDGVELVPLDVTSDASVSEAVAHVLARAGHLHGLVNNAGYVLIGSLEETSLAEARRQFETNVFGVLRMIDAVLPAMREQGSGRIVNISSVLGFLPGPYMGIYAATKHAIEGYTETLDHEIRQFGVRALLVEPDFTRTNIESNGKAVERDIGAYAAQKARVYDVIQDRVKNGSNPRAVAETIHTALTAASPRLRYPVDGGVKLSLLRRFVPARMFDSSFRKQFRLDDDGRPVSGALAARRAAVDGHAAE